MPVTFTFKGTTPSNKAEKYLLQLTARAYGYKDSEEGAVNVLSPVVDKLSVTVPIKDKSAQRAIAQALMDIPKKNAEFSSLSMAHKRYKKSISWLDEKSGQSVVVQADPYNKSSNYLRFELNPHKLGPKGMSRFKDMINFDLNYGNLPYKKIIDTGRITRADIAVDFINVPMNELIVVGKNSGKSIKYAGSNSETETVYLDKPKATKSLKIIYNKLQEQKDTDAEFTYNGVSHTRVEYNHQGGPLKKIESIHNPFKKMKIIHPIKKPDDIEGWLWKLFLNSCRETGLENSLGLLPKQIADQFKNVLDHAAEDTWKPEKLWENWPQYIQKSGILAKD